MKKLLGLTLITLSLLLCQEGFFIQGLGGVYVGSTTYSTLNESGTSMGSFFLGDTRKRSFFGITIPGSIFAGWGIFSNTVGQWAYFPYQRGTEFFIYQGSHLSFEFLVGWGYSTSSYFINLGLAPSLNLVNISANYVAQAYDPIFGYTILCNASVGGGVKTKFGLSLYAVLGKFLGSPPLIGGLWGVFLFVKSSSVGDIDYSFSGDVTCSQYDSLGVKVGEITQKFSKSNKLNFDNTTYGIGLNYNF